jgi:hypothetical protein
LDKLDRYTCLKESGVIIPAEGEDGSSEDEGDEEDEDETDNDETDDESTVADEVQMQVNKEDVAMEAEGEGDGDQRHAEKIQEDKVGSDKGGGCSLTYVIFQAALRSQANAFMGVAKDNTRSLEDVISTPLPGETLASFYARSRKCSVSA